MICTNKYSVTFINWLKALWTIIHKIYNIKFLVYICQDLWFTDDNILWILSSFLAIDDFKALFASSWFCTTWSKSSNCALRGSNNDSVALQNKIYVFKLRYVIEDLAI